MVLENGVLEVNENRGTKIAFMSKINTVKWINLNFQLIQ